MLQSIIERLFGAFRSKPGRKPPRVRLRRLRVESLESRQLLSGATPLTGISDANFASPALAPNAYQVAPSGSPWQFTGSAGVSGNASGFTTGNMNAPTGTQVGFIKNSGSISQQVNLLAGVYNLSFQSAQRFNYQTQNQTLEMLVDGAEVGIAVPASFNPNGTTNTVYTPYQSNNFSVTAGVHTVEILGLSPSSADSTAFVSEVAVTPVLDGLVDSSFEEPGLAPNSYATLPSGTAWQFAGTSGVSRNGSDFATNWVEAQNAPAGFQVGYLQDTGSISQTVYLDTGVYQISMFAAQRAIYQSSYQTFQVLFDGTPLATIDPVNTFYGTYQTPVFTATAGVHTVKLVGLNPQGGDNTAFVDSVTLAASSSINDDSFETPVLAANAYQTAPTGTAWTYAGAAGIAANGSTFTSNNPSAPDGTQVGFIKNGGSMTQSIYMYAGVYNLSLQAAQRGSGNSQDQSIQILLDGSQIGLITPSSTNYYLYQTLNFTVTTGSHTVEFLGLAPSSADSTALIDLTATKAVNDSLSDGGFETPILAANTFQTQPDATPWQFSGTSGISTNTSQFTAGNANAPSGTQVAFVKNTGSMSQTVYLDTGGYNISFLAAQRGNYQSAAQQIEVLVDGSVVGTATPGYTNYNIYQTMNFQATAGPHTIEFLGLNNAGGDVTAFIDQITLAPAEDGTSNNSSRFQYSNAVTDGSFEYPAQPTNGYQVAPDGNPWQFTGIAGVAYNNSAFTTITTGGSNVVPNGLQNVAPSGLQVGFIKNDASISQAVYLDAGLYNVTLEAAQRFNYQSQPQQIEVLVDGVPVSVITPVATYIPATTTRAAATNPAYYYAPYQSDNFQVTAGMHTIKFLGLAPSSADSTALIDSVSVNNANGANDGNFETPVMATGNYSFTPAGTPWQFSGAAGIATNASAFTIGNPNTPDGNQVAFIKQTGSMSQSVYLTSGLYSVSFLAEQRATSQDSYQEIEILIDGTDVGMVIPSNTTTATPPVPTWGTYQTSTFTVTTGLHTLEFLGVNPQGGDNTVLVDQVSF